MNELAYQLHIKKAKQAEELYRSLRDIYGNDLDRDHLFRRARFDKLISDEENRLLLDFVPMLSTFK